MKLPNVVTKLIENLKLLPGIGQKTALRLALFIVNELDEQVAIDLSEAIYKAKTEICFCEICGSIKEELCPFCDNNLRDSSTIIVVESLKDLMVIENGHNYNGLYHILKGTIDFSKGIEPEDLNIDTLLNRLENVKEVILALNGSIDGQLTTNYLQELLKDKQIIITKIAQGIPIGADLSYADEKTLKIALDNRVILK